MCQSRPATSLTQSNSCLLVSPTMSCTREMSRIRGIFQMTTHTNEQFTRIVDILNLMFKDKMTFQLVGSLAEKPASYHDADIVVYPHPVLPPGIALEGF